MRPLLAAMAVLVAVAGCSSPHAPQPPQGPAPGDFGVAEPSTPADHPDGFGSEPSLLVASDGALYFTSVLGSAEARGDGLWKSTDEGHTWTYLGKADYPFGGGDSDLDELAGGRLLLTGQWRPAAAPSLPGVGSPYITGGESVSYSDDGGQSWNPRPTAGYLPAADRNWIATHGADTAWLVFNVLGGGLMVGKTTDGGVTWLPPVMVPGTDGPNGIAGDAVADANGTLYIPYGPGPGGGTVQRVFRSDDGGQGFKELVAHRTPEAESSGAIFSTLALDNAGGLYLAYAETKAEGMRVFLVHSQDKGETWSEPVQVVPDTVTAVFPWVVAGSPGRVAVGYYGANGSFMPDEAPQGTPWHPTVAFATGDGGFTHEGAFAHVRMVAKPNHLGPICTGGTGCDPAFRQLGDFFEIAALGDGRVAMVYVDDTVEGRPNSVVVQRGGPGLL